MKGQSILNDAAIEAMLARRAGRGAPAGLAESIANALEAGPARRRTPWAVLVPGADWSPALRIAWALALIGLLLAVSVSAVAVGSRLVSRGSELGILPPAGDPLAVEAAPPAAAASTLPFHPIPDALVTVSGTGDCTPDRVAGTNPATGGPGWLVTCRLDMTDPRVDGVEVADRIRITSRGGVGYVWVAEEVTITNDRGSWRGVLQTADDGQIRHGEGHFVGAGAYQGLEYHYYFGVTADDTHTRTGWIYESGE